MSFKRPIALTCLAGVLVIAGCGSGESEQAKAEKSVCEAKSGLSSTVKSLQATTIETVTIAQLQTDVTSITANLKKFAEAQGELKGVRKEQVEKANEELKSQLSTLSSAITKLNLSEAKSALTTAAHEVAKSYEQALARVECPTG